MIREYKENDLDIIMKIWQEENLRAHSFIPKEYWKNNYEYVKSILPKAEVLVYTIDGNIAGFIGVNNNYIEGIFISKNFQNKNIGTELLKHIQKEKERLSLRVYEKNTKAIKFYIKNSFRIKTKELDESTGEYEYLIEWNLE